MEFEELTGHRPWASTPQRTDPVASMTRGWPLSPLSHPQRTIEPMQTRTKEHSLSPVQEAARLRRTIEAYDSIAEAYAARFDGVDLAGERCRFVRGLTTPVVLDAGCGTGRDCRLLEDEGLRVIGIDLSAGMLAAARRRTKATLLRSDVRAVPFGHGVFGGVWACAVLLHLDSADFLRALREFSRVLTEYGSLFLSVREGSGDELRVERGGTSRWHRRYRATEVAALLFDAGFSVEECSVVPGTIDGTWVNVHAKKSSC